MSLFNTKCVENKIDLKRQIIRTLQVNIGRLCNQACLHCHVEAGPKRKENMSFRTLKRILDLLEHSDEIDLVDITGGAPELNPHFRNFVSGVRGLGIDVMDRCNLTVLLLPGQEDTIDFLAQNKVKVTASLPCYLEKNVNQQRGNGVFTKSIQVLKKLNQLGYGKKESGLELNLVYNPLGFSLPPKQATLEMEYKKRLDEWFGIKFNSLFVITNMPIKRFLKNLKRQGQLEFYMQVLIDSFNPIAAKQVMCRSLVSIGYDGSLYDCDFNQMLEIPLGNQELNIWNIQNLNELQKQSIATDKHCFGCTAGAGSSCGGETV